MTNKATGQPLAFEILLERGAAFERIVAAVQARTSSGSASR